MRGRGSPGASGAGGDEVEPLRPVDGEEHGVSIQGDEAAITGGEIDQPLEADRSEVLGPGHQGQELVFGVGVGLGRLGAHPKPVHLEERLGSAVGEPHQRLEEGSLEARAPAHQLARASREPNTEYPKDVAPRHRLEPPLGLGDEAGEPRADVPEPASTERHDADHHEQHHRRHRLLRQCLLGHGRSGAEPLRSIK